jgi:hypothetical protein
MVMRPEGLGPEKDCAGEAQQQVLTTDLSSRQRAKHINIHASVQS